MQLKSRLALGTAGAAVAGAVILAACGGSGTTHTAAPAAATSATTVPTSTAPPSSGPAVTTKKDSKLGTILADGKGLTLYTLTNNGKAVDCTGACAAVWPPLTATGGVPMATPGAGSLGTATLSDGTHVVTAGGLPLYRFAQDEDSGDTYGEGLATFGGVWHVVKVGQPTSAAAAPAPRRPAMSLSNRSAWSY